MAKASWSGEKVEKLIQAIRDKDIESIDSIVEMYGGGKLPDKDYGRTWKYGPSDILAACIKTEDVDLFDHLLELGMRNGRKLPETSNETLFGGYPDWKAFVGRSHEMLRRLAENGYDFSSVKLDVGYRNPLRSFVAECRDDFGILLCLEQAGLKYPRSSYYGDPQYVEDEEYIKSGWRHHESIPWEALLSGECFSLLDHFIDAGFNPARPLRLMVGNDSDSSPEEASALHSKAAVDYLCDKQLPTFGLIVSDLGDGDREVLIHCLKRGVKLYNPEPVFESLDYELIKLALDMKACEVKPEYVGPAQAANREDILKLFEEFGVASDDVTSLLVEELEALVEGAEYKTNYYNPALIRSSHSPKEHLRIVDALKEDATADWKHVTDLLARLYCASYDMLDDGCSSKRAQALEVFAGDRAWPEIFEACLSRFEENLDIHLTLPMAKVSWRSHLWLSKGCGITYWFESDAEVYKQLAERGVTFDCKTDKRSYVSGEAIDARRGDAFIWLSPEVSELLFAQNGWEKKRLDFGEDESKLTQLLIQSGNRSAYQWFSDNASDYSYFKQPAVKDVVESPLLRPYLEGKKDASVRSKDNVDFIMQTISGDFRDDTVLYVSKAALNEKEIEALKAKLSAVKDDDRRAIAQEAIAILDERQAQPKKPKKEKTKKPTIPQIVTLVADALDEGDTSKLAELEPIAAKVPMADCVELLEHAAAMCDGAAIDRLYELFAPFECASSALLVALFSGNVSTAKALVAHGADLEGKLMFIDAKRTPSSKRDAREKRYSHGLMTSTYYSGGRMAWSLREALTKDNGQIESRSKTEKDWSGRDRKIVVNKTSNTKAAETLVAISEEKGFKKSIATRLLWNLISFDGRKTTDARFDAENARKILEAGILTPASAAKLPWVKAIDSLVFGGLYGNPIEAYRLVRDYAAPEVFAKCWRPQLAKPDRYSHEYENIETLLLFIDVLDADSCSNQTEVLRALAETGQIEALKELAEKPGWFTKQRIKKLIDIASEAGQTEMTAWLLELADSE